MSTTTNQQLSQSAIDNLESIESEIETSSNYFKPKPGRTYVIRIDPQNKIVPIENGVVITDAIKFVQDQIDHLNKSEKLLLQDIKQKKDKDTIEQKEDIEKQKTINGII